MAPAPAEGAPPPRAAVELGAPTWVPAEGRAIGEADPFADAGVPAALRPLTRAQITLAMAWPAAAAVAWPGWTGAGSVGGMLRAAAALGLAAVACAHVLGCALMVAQKREHDRAFARQWAKR